MRKKWYRRREVRAQKPSPIWPQNKKEKKLGLKEKENPALIENEQERIWKRRNPQGPGAVQRASSPMAGMAWHSARAFVERATAPLPLPAQRRHSDRAKKMTSPSMLLSLDRPSPAAAAAAALLLLLLDAAPGDEGLVAVTGPSVEIVIVNDPSVAVVVPLAGASTRVTVKFAALVDGADVLGRDQVVVGEEVQSVVWATWSGLLGFVSCAWARVVAPRAARM